MLGKIFDQGEQTHIFNVIVKTSNTGLFSNKRLGILAIKTAQIGYMSKVPDQLEQYQNPNCMQQCKQTLNITAVKNFMYYLNPDAKNILILKWQDEKDKTWEFKFDNEEISSQWYHYITNVLYPPPKAIQKPPQQPLENLNQQLNKVQPTEAKPQQPKVDYSKLQKPSRFKPSDSEAEPQSKKQEQMIKIIESKQYDEEPSDLSKSPSISNFSVKTKSPNRFKSFEDQNHDLDQSVENMRLPIITTFRQKFPNQNIFNSLNNRDHQEDSTHYQGNWNLRWYEAIQTEQQQARIKIYNEFLSVSEQTCLQIIKELTKLKKQRKLIPERVTMNEEIYKSQQIEIRLIIQRDIDYNSEALCSSHHFKAVRQQLENLKYILKATKNKGFIKVPLACEVSYLGFYFFCEASVPSNYTEVEHSSKYLFQKQINRLQQHLKLRIGLANINLYTNKPNSSPQTKSNRASYIIARGLKNLLPSAKGKGIDNSYFLPRNIFLDSYEILSVTKDSTYYDEIKQKLYSNFLKSESIEKCSIISYQDLILSLETFNIPIALIDELITLSNNRYINKIIITEIVSQTVCYIIRSQINKFVKSWNSHLVNMESNQEPDYKNVIFKIVDELFSDFCLYNVWNTINNIAFQKSNFTIKKQDLIIGHLLSSISIKTGIQFDYQLLIHQRHRFYLESSVIPPKAILEHHPVFLKYELDEMCMSYEQIIQQLSNQRVDEHKLEQVVSFFNLKSVKNEMQPYLWGKICKFVSLFVPYDKQQNYKHLAIYSCLNLFYLDYDIFNILVSAIKWLLHESRIDDALQLVFFFKDISWFWVSQTNPFLVIFYEIIAQYYRTKKSLKQSIHYLNQSQQSLYKLYKTQPELQSLDKNYQLAHLYMLCNMHKQALSKFRQVKHTIKKFDKESLIVLDVLVQISKLYLHLSDLDRCIRYCKETIDYSILNPFKNEDQQFQIYAVLIRALQIKDEQHKYKFYIDIIEQKFNRTNNSFILQKVLKLTCQQYLQTIKPYYLKKLAFLIYFYQSKQNPSVEESPHHTQLFKTVKKIPVKQTLSRYLRDCLDKSVDIIDQLIIIQQKQKRYEEPERLQFQGDAQNLRILCSFVGFDYIVGQVVANLKKREAV